MWCISRCDDASERTLPETMVNTEVWMMAGFSRTPWTKQGNIIDLGPLGPFGRYSIISGKFVWGYYKAKTICSLPDFVTQSQFGVCALVHVFLCACMHAWVLKCLSWPQLLLAWINFFLHGRILILLDTFVHLDKTDCVVQDSGM